MIDILLKSFLEALWTLYVFINDWQIDNYINKLATWYTFSHLYYKLAMWYTCQKLAYKIKQVFYELIT